MHEVVGVLYVLLRLVGLSGCFSLLGLASMMEIWLIPDERPLGLQLLWSFLCIFLDHNVVPACLIAHECGVSRLLLLLKENKSVPNTLDFNGPRLNGLAITSL